jgi:hypothetical protein
MAVDSYVEVLTTVAASDGRVLQGTGCEDVLYESSDPSVVSLSVDQDKLVLYGTGSGTAEITAVRKDQSLVIIPSTGITGQPLLVTVT